MISHVKSRVHGAMGFDTSVNAGLIWRCKRDMRTSICKEPQRSSNDRDSGGTCDVQSARPTAPADCVAAGVSQDAHMVARLGSGEVGPPLTMISALYRVPKQIAGIE